MFDIAPTEFLLVAVVALLVIGPKDLPKAMRVVGYWVGKMRGVARQFRTGFDNMVREAELEEMEKRWAAENERIMREHSDGALTVSASAGPTHDAAAAEGTSQNSTLRGNPGETAPEGPFDGEAPAEAEPVHQPDLLPDDTSEPVHVEKPEIRPAPAGTSAPRGDGVTS